MKEKNIDPSSLKGTGRDGRIMKEDVMSLPSNKDIQAGDISSPKSEEKSENDKTETNNSTKA